MVDGGDGGDGRLCACWWVVMVEMVVDDGDDGG